MAGIMPLAEGPVDWILSVRGDLIGTGWVLRLEEGGDFFLETAELGPQREAVHIKLWAPGDAVRLYESVPIPGTVRCNPGEPCEAWLLYKLRHEQWREEVVKRIQELAKKAGIAEKRARLYKLSKYGYIVSYKGRTT